MHANIGLILTLTSGLAAALALGYATHGLGLSPVVGYLLAGIAVGPNTPGFVYGMAIVSALLFGVGMASGAFMAGMGGGLRPGEVGRGVAQT